MAYNNGFAEWMNNMGSDSADTVLIRDPDTEDWNEALHLLELAIKEAKLVSPEFLIKAHEDLPEMWEGFYIPAIERVYTYYSNAINNPESIQLPSSPAGQSQLDNLMRGRMLDEFWMDWYNQNIEDIRANIRNLAK